MAQLNDLQRQIEQNEARYLSEYNDQKQEMRETDQAHQEELKKTNEQYAK